MLWKMTFGAASLAPPQQVSPVSPHGRANQSGSASTGARAAVECAADAAALKSGVVD